MMEFNRLENETDAQLMLRICQLKDQIGTWKDVADILNGLTNNNYDESTYRRRYKKEIQIPKVKSEIDDLRAERIKLQTANLERQRLDRVSVRQQMYYEYIGRVVSSLPLPEFKSIYESREESIEYLLTISDIHYGSYFESENNSYSSTEAEHRLELLTGYTIDFIKKNQLNKIHVAELGDTIFGILRLKDLQANDSTVVKAVVEISRLLAHFLNEVSAYAHVEYYHVPFANHSQIRPLGTKASELVSEDLEYIIGNYISDLCRYNNRINVNLAEEGKQYIHIPITGSTIYAMHGHQIKNLESAIKDMTILTKTFIDYLVLGHFHTGRNIPSGEGVCSDTETLVCPSFVGSDPYSDSLMKGSKAAVNIFGFDSLYGRTETYKFILN